MSLVCGVRRLLAWKLFHFGWFIMPNGMEKDFMTMAMHVAINDLPGGGSAG